MDSRHWLIAGLGNPGPGYARTRHNLGFQIVDRLAEKHGLTWGRGKVKGNVAEGRIGDARVTLLKPMTWMNDSGDAVQPLLHWHKLPPEQLLVVYDELDLPPGRLRIREKGSAGGHNGVGSIIRRLGTNGFPRIRVGIGRRPGPEQVDHVLSVPRRDEEPLLEEARVRAVEAIETILERGVVAAMNEYNTTKE